MTKFFTPRKVLVFTGILLMVGIFSFSGKASCTESLEGSECRISIENEENELFWETLSRQFSGSVSAY